MARLRHADLYEQQSLGDGRTAMPGAQRTIDHAEITALRSRVRERRLVAPDDYLLIDELLGRARVAPIAPGRERSDAEVGRRADEAGPAALVVAAVLVDEELLTLKRVYRERGNKVRLQPESDRHEPQIYASTRVKR